MFNVDTEVSLAMWLTACGATTEVPFLSNMTWYTCRDIKFPEATSLPLELAAWVRMCEMELRLHVGMRSRDEYVQLGRPDVSI